MNASPPFSVLDAIPASATQPVSVYLGIDREYPGFFAKSVSPSAFCIWSFVFLSRNLAGRPFPAAATPEARLETVRILSDAVSRRWGALSVFAPGDPAAGSLLPWLASEGRLAGEPLAGGKPLPETCFAIPKRARRHAPGIPSRSALFNNREHLRIDFNGPGECLEALWNKASAFDDDLSAELSFAFSPEIGYLLSSPTLSGAAFHPFCLLHLPATVWLGLLPVLSDVLRDAGYGLRPWAVLEREDSASPPGALCEVFPLRHLRASEPRTVASLRAVVRHVCDREAATLARLRAQAPTLLLDRLQRAAATANAAVRTRPAEALDWISDLRLARLLGFPGIDTPREFFRAALLALHRRSGPADPLSLPDDVLRAALLRTVAAAARPVEPPGAGPQPPTTDPRP